MLIQMPRGSKDQAGTQNAEECTAFEAALRRDLASAPVISYETVIGGAAKRVIDVGLTVLSAPFWAPLMLGAAAWSKARHPSRVFQAQERIGYGGAAFQCLSLRLEPPTAVIERLPIAAQPDQPANDWAAVAGPAEEPQTKWRRAIERLPRLINVLRGEMSLVGPAPLAREELEPLKTAKRHYLSARPGLMGISAIADANEEEASQYKLYGLSWSVMTDSLIMLDALRSLLRRGERPTSLLRRKLAADVQEATDVLPRRRGDGAV